MEFSKISLIATDLDGTLLNSRHELSDEFRVLFGQLKTKNVYFAAASGRQYWSLLDTFNPMKDEVIFVAENGGYVVYRDEEILVQPMEQGITETLIPEARRIEDCNIVLCGKKQAYIESSNGQFVENVKKYYKKFTMVEDLLSVKDDDFLKIAIYDAVGAEENSYARFEKFQQDMQVTVSGQDWLDICDRKSTKGNAIKAIQERFNISRDETMVFGDYGNDLTMLKEAFFSYAVANAHPDIIKAASFKTSTNDENGVEQILRKVIEAK